jgi:hypothetical protein
VEESKEAGEDLTPVVQIIVTAAPEEVKQATDESSEDAAQKKMWGDRDSGSLTCVENLTIEDGSGDESKPAGAGEAPKKTKRRRHKKSSSGTGVPV